MLNEGEGEGRGKGLKACWFDEVEDSTQRLTPPEMMMIMMRRHVHL